MTVNRKTYQGPSNDKERSKQKLIKAVGAVIREDGYQGLTPTNIARHAGLNRKLVYLYFDSPDALIETYIRSKDYFIGAERNAGQQLQNYTSGSTQVLLERVLLDQLDQFLHNKEWQKILLWQLSEPSKVMFEIAEQREQLGEAFFKLTETEFKDKATDLRATAALLVAGIYHLVLHSATNASLFCGIDIRTPEGLARIKTTIVQMIKTVYT